MFNIVTAVIVADFIAGFFHWLEDTYCSDGLPFVGELICDPNIDHHVRPAGMKEGSIVSRNWIQWLLCAAVLFITYLIFGWVSWWWFTVMFVVSWTNEVHAWQHGAINNEFTKFVFDTGIIQSKLNHSKHHKPPYMSGYCILLDINNAWMDRVGFWRGLETVIGWFGLKPRRELRRDYVRV